MYPATMLANVSDNNNTNNNNLRLHHIRIIVMQQTNCKYLNIFTHCIEWKIARIIWIGFYKNDKNDDCFIPILGKDIVHFILKFLGYTLVQSDNVDNCKYIVL